MNIDELKTAARQYLGLKDQISLLSGRQSELKSRLLNELEDVEPEDNGHKIVAFDDPNIGTVRVTKQRRVSKNLDMSVAEDLLTKKGIYNTCVKEIKVLDEDAIMTAYYEGLLTEQDIDAMFPSKESFALLVDNK